MKTEIARVKTYLLDLQQSIYDMLKSVDAEIELTVDDWDRPLGGFGKSMVVAGGQYIEQGGFNFSHVHGTQMPPSATEARPELAGKAFEALGVSVVIHPKNPMIPTSHMNVRLFVAGVDTENPVWWIGGGFDLTPYYGFDEDCVYWHQMAKSACDSYSDDLYPKLKKWCDEYFHLAHRDEPRGIGGIFYDDMNEGGFEKCFDFMQRVGSAYVEAYAHIIEKRKETPYTEAQRDFQLYRRGRYVEFNLLYDRGTIFGIQSKGRTESILVSMPPLVKWRYNWQPEAGSQEALLYEKYLVPREWVD